MSFYEAIIAEPNGSDKYTRQLDERVNGGGDTSSSTGWWANLRNRIWTSYSRADRNKPMLDHSNKTCSR